MSATAVLNGGFTSVPDPAITANPGARTVAALNELRDLFICPISTELMRDPVAVDCPKVHIFEKIQVRTWIETQQHAGRTPTCPLCKKNITSNPKDAPIIRSAIEILRSALTLPLPNAAETAPISAAIASTAEVRVVVNMGDTQRAQLEIGVDLMDWRRTADAAANIPSRVPREDFPPGFSDRLASATRRSAEKTAEVCSKIFPPAVSGPVDTRIRARVSAEF